VDQPTLRQQMAVFLLKAQARHLLHASALRRRLRGRAVPVDVRQLDRGARGRGDHRGCGGGNYCPTARSPRPDGRLPAEGRARSAYRRRRARGLPRRPCPSTFADWIEQLSAENITGGCGGGNYCPLSNNTRGQMAVFITKTFDLQ
jgi:hypothetical protein